MNWKGLGRKWFEIIDILPRHIPDETGKSRKTFRIALVQPEIRTKHLPNESLDQPVR
jgi:hypothetical protein